jgi:hypothetical protein
MKIILVGMALACVGCAVWPYYALYDLVSALKAADPVGIERRIEWNEVRQGLRDDLHAVFLQKITADSASASTASPGATALTALIGPQIIDRVIDAYATPQAVANLIQHGKIEGGKPSATAQQSPEQLSSFWDRTRYAFFFTRPHHI